MNKEEFFRKLENKLTIFNDKTRKEILKEYESIITDENVKDEKFNDVLKEIYNKHGLNLTTIKRKDFLYEPFEDLFNVIHHMVDVMSKNDFQGNLKIILDLLVLIALICLMKIPFIFIRNLGDSLIQYLKMPIVSTIWGFIIDILYIIVAVMLFMNIFTKWFSNLQNELHLKKSDSLESITLNEENK